MASAAPVSKDNVPNKGPALNKKAAPGKASPAEPLVPPDEQFWQRYSPHGEMGISGATSLVMHVLILVLVVFGALLMPWWFASSPSSIPVDTVRIAANAGGGGKRGGVGDGPGLGQATAPATTEKDPTVAQPIEPEERPVLDPNAAAAAPIEVQKDPEFQRAVERGNPNINVFKQVGATAMGKLRQGITAGAGQGGTGSGGGRGEGTGTGTGNGAGAGVSGALTNREKRMLRWVSQFETRNGDDYLAQLKALDFILIIPMDREGKQLKVIRDLSGKGKLLDEDLSGLQRIFWTDSRPGSVRDMALALHLRFVPPYFMACMPEKLEARLFELEKQKAGGRPEDQIDETKFRMERQSNGTIIPVLVSITFKR